MFTQHLRTSLQHKELPVGQNIHLPELRGLHTRPVTDENGIFHSFFEVITCQTVGQMTIEPVDRTVSCIDKVLRV
jgi:hypothetical protein